MPLATVNKHTAWERALRAVEDPYAPIPGVETGPFAGITFEKALLFRMTLRGYLVEITGTGTLPGQAEPQVYVIHDLTLPSDQWDSLGLGSFSFAYELRLGEPEEAGSFRHMGLGRVASIMVLEPRRRYLCAHCGRYRRREDIYFRYYDTWPQEWWEVDPAEWPKMYEVECRSRRLRDRCS